MRAPQVAWFYSAAWPDFYSAIDRAYRSAQDGAEPVVLLEYQPGRGQVHPQTFLGDYRGILMSDGYQAWRALKDARMSGAWLTPGEASSTPLRPGRNKAGRPRRH